MKRNKSNMPPEQNDSTTNFNNRQGSSVRQGPLRDNANSSMNDNQQAPSSQSASMQNSTTSAMTGGRHIFALPRLSQNTNASTTNGSVLSTNRGTMQNTINSSTDNLHQSYERLRHAPSPPAQTIEEMIASLGKPSLIHEHCNQTEPAIERTRVQLASQQLELRTLTEHRERRHHRTRTTTTNAEASVSFTNTSHPRPGQARRQQQPASNTFSTESTSIGYTRFQRTEHNMVAHSSATNMCPEMPPASSSLGQALLQSIRGDHTHANINDYHRGLNPTAAGFDSAPVLDNNTGGRLMSNGQPTRQFTSVQYSTYESSSDDNLGGFAWDTPPSAVPHSGPCSPPGNAASHELSNAFSSLVVDDRVTRRSSTFHNTQAPPQSHPHTQQLSGNRRVASHTQHTPFPPQTQPSSTYVIPANQTAGHSRVYRSSNMLMQNRGLAQRNQSRLATGTNYRGDIYSSSFLSCVPGLPDHLNCVLWIQGIPSGAYNTFFDIIEEGPVWALTFNPPDERHDTWAARLVFLTTEAARAFWLRGNCGRQLWYRGNRLKVDYNRIGCRRRETSETRVLHIDGPAHLLTWTYMKTLFDDACEYNLDRWSIIESPNPELVRMEVRFGRVDGQAQSCTDASTFRRDLRGILFVQYDPDPCDRRRLLGAGNL